jgi:hypothetical protein
LLYADLVRGVAPDVEDLVRRITARCEAEGGHPIIDGKPVEDPAEAYKLIADDYKQRIERVIPLWRMMQMV